MYTNVSLAAPIGAMAFLGTGLLFFGAGLIFLYTIIKGELAGTKVVVSAIAVVGAIYIGFLLLFSFTSSETVLARGQEKHFCELDCHLSYSILDVRQTKTLGNGPNEAKADGLYHIVTIKTRLMKTPSAQPGETEHSRQIVASRPLLMLRDIRSLLPKMAPGPWRSQMTLALHSPRSSGQARRIQPSSFSICPQMSRTRRCC